MVKDSGGRERTLNGQTNASRQKEELVREEKPLRIRACLLWVAYGLFMSGCYVDVRSFPLYIQFLSTDHTSTVSPTGMIAVARVSQSNH